MRNSGGGPRAIGCERQKNRGGVRLLPNACGVWLLRRLGREMAHGVKWGMAGYEFEGYDDSEMMDLPSELYSTTTRQIRICVEPIYLEDQSAPDESHFMWAYRVQIENTGTEPVQLRTRYWRILDSMGRVQEVRGVGVVGQQPVIHPGEVFEYTSGTPLSTPSGIMMGNYQMETDGGETFDVDIPVFSLDSPHEQRQVH